MNRLIFFLFIFFYFSCSSSNKNSNSVANTITGKVVSVADGDTFTLLTDEKKQIKIRLNGVDCPEKRQDFGERAKRHTSDFIFGKNVIVEIKDIDHYGRVVGIVTLSSGENLNESLLENGLAWHYKQYDNSKKYADLETQARKNKRGLWSSKNAVEPWNFRKVQKENKKSAKEKGIVYICNSKGSKSYHDEDCRSLSTCKSELISLAVSDAENKGYKACGRCQK
ncbi:thermonuclease family protein [Bacteroidales bacterium OttesenSCG-928-C19]|nr:thermonuclease family protein [Bacteroidales bacterium OttesenSCG-928-C19]